MNPEIFSLGVVISILFWWITGLSAGGIITPVYIFLFLNQPLRVFYTLLIGFLTYLVVCLFNRYFILYGRKRMAAGILVGVVLKLAFDYLTINYFPLDYLSTIIGTIIPGLIANDIYKQGFIKTFLSLGIVSILIWFVVYGFRII